jgi:hypothetical protein
MPYKKENLEKLILLLDQICADKENNWFKEKLLSQLIGNIPDTNNEQSIGFESYFKLLRKQFRIKANKLYENIKEKQLKHQLVSDCMQMYWHQINNDIHQLFVSAFFQMENMLNYYVSYANCYQKISANRNYYAHSFSEKFSVACSISFFEKDNTEKSLIKVNIWGKLVFWAYDTMNIEFLKKQSNNFSNMINIRNNYIHKSSEENKPENYNIELLRLNDYSSFGYYINLLKEIAKTLDNINTVVDKKEYKETGIELPGVKVIGKIDLDKFKRS